MGGLREKGFLLIQHPRIPTWQAAIVCPFEIPLIAALTAVAATAAFILVGTDLYQHVQLDSQPVIEAG